MKPAPYAGQALAEALEYYRSEGLPLLYSTDLIEPAMKVLSKPTASDPLDQVNEILEGHRLTTRQLDGLNLVVRSAEKPIDRTRASIILLIDYRRPEQDIKSLKIDAQPSLGAARALAPGVYEFSDVAPGHYRISIHAPGYQANIQNVRIDGAEIELLKLELALAPAQLEELNVSTSRYVLVSNSQFYIDQSAIQVLPDLGEDPVRSVHRLPGTAASGLSARSHFRGGENDETAIYFNGLKLTDPFHIRDYHSIFSSIDARAISGVEAYTGGFPARYGDQMSGVLLLESQRPDLPRHHEIGVSIYNTSLLTSGYSEDGKWEWLGSARRSNLSILLSNSLGKPDYFDLFSELAVNLNDRTRLSFNVLYADDQVVVITESDPEELEKSTSKTQNGHAWLRLENQWSDQLGSDTSIWASTLENSRLAEVNDPEKLTGAVDDQRDIQTFGISQNWALDTLIGHHLRWGFEWAHQRAHYDYQSRAEYFEFAAAWPGLENPQQLHVSAAPKGPRYAFFVSDSWQISEQNSMDLGLRWDQQDYTQVRFSGQFSPRISWLHQLSARTELRASWGRYFQSQAIQRLQVEDGISEFFEPQQSDHFIIGVRHRSPADYRFRVEIFQKNYDHLKPRFENLFDSLALIPELSPDRIQINPTSAMAHGLEISVEHHGDKDLEWWANYTWSRATDRIGESDQLRSWDQTHAIQAGLAWHKGAWEIGLAVNWHTGWPTTSMELGYNEEEDEYYPITGPRNALRLKNYSSLDFRISREFQVSRGRLSAFFEVSNATNRKNICCIDYDTDEDDEGNVYLDPSNDYWLPLLPAVGLFWEF